MGKFIDFDQFDIKFALAITINFFKKSVFRNRRMILNVSKSITVYVTETRNHRDSFRNGLKKIGLRY